VDERRKGLKAFGNRVTMRRSFNAKGARQAMTPLYERGFSELQAAREIGVEETLFPAVCPFTVEQILDDHWPDAAA
jgi:hypothetical protein